MASSSLSGSAVGLGSVDLSLIWALLGGFVFASLLLSGFGRLKFVRHRRRSQLQQSEEEEEGEETGEAEGEQAAAAVGSAASLRSFASLLLSQRAFASSLLRGQQSAVRSQFDRLCAEAEQLKALLALKLSDDRGFVDAALSLLLAESTAAASARLRQGRRERELGRLLEAAVTQAAALAADAPSPPPASALSQLKESTAAFTSLSSVLLREAERERGRRGQQASSASSIIGPSAAALLSRHAADEAESERGLHRLLRAALRQLHSFRFDCLELEVEATQRRKPDTAMDAAAARRLRLASRRLHAELGSAAGRWDGSLAPLLAVRALRSEDEAAAMDSLEQQKAEMEATRQHGLFASLDPQLADGLRAILRQRAEQRQPGRDGGSLTLAAAQPLQHPPAGSAVPPASASFLLSSLRAAGTEPQPSAVAERLLLPAEAAGCSSSALSELYGEWLQRERVLASVDAAERDRQLAVCQELDRQQVTAAVEAEAGDGQQAAALQAAETRLLSLDSAQRRQQAEAADRRRVDEQKQAERLLASLREEETAAAVRTAELEADYAARRTAASRAAGDAGAAEGEADTAELQSAHSAALAAVTEQLAGAQLRCRAELLALHHKMAARRDREAEELRERQRLQREEAQAALVSLSDALEARVAAAAEARLQVEGVELAELQRAAGEAELEAEPRLAALRSFQAASVAELSRSQAQARQQLQDAEEERRQAELRAAAEDWKEEAEQAWQEAAAGWQERLQAAASDPLTAAALRHQQAEQRRRMDRKVREDWRRREAELQRRAEAELQEAVAALSAQQAAERDTEQDEQQAEMAALRHALQRRREAAALSRHLTEERRWAAPQLIAALTGRREAEEMRLLLQRQKARAEAEMSGRLQAEERQRTLLKAAVQRDEAEGRCSEADGQRRLQELQVQYAPAAVADRVFSSLAAASSSAIAGLQRAQWEERRALMLSRFPEADLTGAEWQLQDAGQQLSDIAALRLRQLEAEQAETGRALQRLQEREAEAVQAAQRERLRRLQQVERAVADEADAVRRNFSLQLQAANAEHEAKLREVEAELQARLADCAPEAELERAELQAAYAAVLADERSSQAALLSQAEQQLEAELTVRSEAERVHQRQQIEAELTASMRQARTQRDQQSANRLSRQRDREAELQRAAGQAVRRLMARGRQLSRRRQQGASAAVQRLMRCAYDSRGSGPPSSAAAAAASASAAPSPQLRVIERLLRRLLVSGEAAGVDSPAVPSSRTPARQPQSSPQAASERQRVAVGAVSRLMSAACRSLGLPPVQVSLDEQQPGGSVEAAAPLCLPQSQLYCFDPRSRCLQLRWDGASPVSAYLLAALYLAASSAAQHAELPSDAAFQLRFQTLVQNVLLQPLVLQAVEWDAGQQRSTDDGKRQRPQQQQQGREQDWQGDAVGGLAAVAAAWRLSASPSSALSALPTSEPGAADELEDERAVQLLNKLTQAV